jgi:hypothetical protein
MPEFLKITVIGKVSQWKPQGCLPDAGDLRL